MTVGTIESGTGEGFRLAIDSAGRAQAAVEEIDRILEPVTARPQVMSVATSTPTALAAGSNEVVAARTGRRWMEIQNLGSNPVHVLLGPSSSPATANHRRIDPGDAWSWRDCVAYEGAVQAIATGGNSALVVMEFHAA